MDPVKTENGWLENGTDTQCLNQIRASQQEGHLGGKTSDLCFYVISIISCSTVLHLT